MVEGVEEAIVVRMRLFKWDMMGCKKQANANKRCVEVQTDWTKEVLMVQVWECGFRYCRVSLLQGCKLFSRSLLLEDPRLNGPHSRPQVVTTYSLTLSKDTIE